MSDLETPEADMMRDQSSVDAAPTTLRLEERSRVLIPIIPVRPLTPRWATSGTDRVTGARECDGAQDDADPIQERSDQREDTRRWHQSHSGADGTSARLRQHAI